MSIAATLIYPLSSLHLDDCDSFQPISVSTQKCPKHLFSSKATVVLLTCQTTSRLCWTSFSDISQNQSQKSWPWPAKPHTTREPWPQFLSFPWFTLLSCPDLLIFPWQVWPAPTRGPPLSLVPLLEFTHLHSHTSAFPHICISSPLHAFVQMSPPWHRLPVLLFNTVPAPSPWTPACLTVFWFFFFSSLCCLLTLYTLFMKSRPHNLSPPRDYLLLEGRGSYLLVYLNCPVT